MTFPVREDTATTSDAGPSYPCNLPASIEAGDVLLIYCDSPTDTLTTPDGWELLTGSGTQHYWFKKTASGSEGATVTITTSGSAVVNAIAERWSGGSGNVEAATSVADVDPPNLAPSWGAKDTAWITSGDLNPTESGVDDSTPPTNYANKVSRCAGFQNCVTAYRLLNAASENPGAWTSPNGAFRITTIAIEPADTTTSNWTNELGDGSPLYSHIDEPSPVDSDYIQSGIDPANDIARVSLSNPGGAIAEPVTLRYRYKKTGSAQINLTVRLMEGATTIATWTHTDIADTFTRAEQELTTEQFESITDPDNLDVEFEANKP